MGDITIKQSWFLILIFFGLSWIIAEQTGEYKQGDLDKQNYSLGYAECKAGMEHKFQTKAQPQQKE